MAQVAPEQQEKSASQESVGTPAGPPPLIFGGALFVGMLLQRLMPIPFLRREAGRVVGGGLILAGVALGAAAVSTMRRAGTSPEPHQPTRAVVTSGPYRYTRNPIYVGMGLLYAGIASFLGALWPLLLLPAALAAVSQGMVEREERYLEQRFGDRYRQYRARVRRWI